MPLKKKSLPKSGTPTKASNELTIGSLVWAKMKGYQPWPAVIDTKPKQFSSKPNYSWVYFFGSKNYSFVENSFIQPYQKFKDLYSKAKPTKSLKDAISEIEKFIENPNKPLPEFKGGVSENESEDVSDSSNDSEEKIVVKRSKLDNSVSKTRKNSSLTKSTKLVKEEKKDESVVSESDETLNNQKSMDEDINSEKKPVKNSRRQSNDLDISIQKQQKKKKVTSMDDDVKRLEDSEEIAVLKPKAETQLNEKTEKSGSMLKENKKQEIVSTLNESRKILKIKKSDTPAKLSDETIKVQRARKKSKKSEQAKYETDDEDDLADIFKNDFMPLSDILEKFQLENISQDPKIGFMGSLKERDEVLFKVFKKSNLNVIFYENKLNYKLLQKYKNIKVVQNLESFANECDIIILCGTDEYFIRDEFTKIFRYKDEAKKFFQNKLFVDMSFLSRRDHLELSLYITKLTAIYIELNLIGSYRSLEEGRGKAYVSIFASKLQNMITSKIYPLLKCFAGEVIFNTTRPAVIFDCEKIFRICDAYRVLLTVESYTDLCSDFEIKGMLNRAIPSYRWNDQLTETDEERSLDTYKKKITKENVLEYLFDLNEASCSGEMSPIFRIMFPYLEKLNLLHSRLEQDLLINESLEKATFKME